MIKVLKIGDINKLKVLRETDIGYMLNERGSEVFLHKNESNFMELKAGDTVDAFLYYDNESRLAATLKTPTLVKGEKAFLEVVSVLPKLGVFLDMGINKDLLLSKHDLPEDLSLWPDLHDKLYVSLEEKGSRLIAKLIDPTSIFVVNELKVGEVKDFYIIKVGPQGVNLLSTNMELLFVHKTLTRGTNRLGELVTAKVINLTDKGYLGSLVAQKEELRLTDAEVILEVLKKHGKMPLTAKSSSQDVARFFKISRKAFKRALGHLYKEDLVTFTETETILINGDKK